MRSASRPRARDPGDGVRRPPRIPAVPGCLPARHLRQHEDGGADRDLIGKEHRVQPALRADVWPLPGRTDSMARRERDGRRGRSEPGRDHPRSVLRPRGCASRPTTSSTPGSWTSCVAYARRHPHPVFGRTGLSGRCSRTTSVPGRLSRAVRRLPLGPGVGVEDLPGALRQQHVQRGGARRRPSGRGPCLPADRIVIRQDGEIVAEHARRFPTATRPSAMTRGTTCPCWRGLPGALRNGAPFKDWAFARRPGSRARPARRPRRRRQADGRDPHRRAGGWAGGGGGRLCRDSLAACAAPTSCSTSSIVGASRPRRRRSRRPRTCEKRFEPVADCTRYDRFRGVGQSAMRLEMMAALKLAGMRDAFDEVLADGLKASIRCSESSASC